MATPYEDLWTKAGRDPAVITEIALQTNGLDSVEAQKPVEFRCESQRMAGRVAYLGTTTEVAELMEDEYIRKGIAATRSEMPGVEARIWETEVRTVDGTYIGYHGIVCGTEPTIDGARGVAYLAVTNAADTLASGGTPYQLPFFGETWAAKIFES